MKHFYHVVIFSIPTCQNLFKVIVMSFDVYLFKINNQDSCNKFRGRCANNFIVLLLNTYSLVRKLIYHKIFALVYFHVIQASFVRNYKIFVPLLKLGKTLGKTLGSACNSDLISKARVAIYLIFTLCSQLLDY